MEDVVESQNTPPDAQGAQAPRVVPLESLWVSLPKKNKTELRKVAKPLGYGHSVINEFVLQYQRPAVRAQRKARPEVVAEVAEKLNVTAGVSAEQLGDLESRLATRFTELLSTWAPQQNVPAVDEVTKTTRAKPTTRQTRSEPRKTEPPIAQKAIWHGLF